METGTAWELLLSMQHVADWRRPRPFEHQAAWRERARRVDRLTIATLRRVGFHGIINLLGAVADLPEGKTADDLLDSIRTRPPSDLVAYAIGLYRRAFREMTPPDVIAAAVDGDSAARRQLLRSSFTDMLEWRTTASFLVSAPADAVGTQIRDAIVDWHQHAFAEVAEAAAVEQDRQREQLLAERPAWSVAALTARLFPDVDLAPAPTVSVVSFVPDAVIRPAVVFLDHAQDYIAVFPVRSDDEGHGDAPPRQLVEIANALGDELRLRALRSLAQRPKGLGELADELGVPRTSLSYHVGVLRRAGLVTMGVDDGRWGRLRLRDAGIGELPALFRGFVESPASELPPPGPHHG